jgi:poly(3-hydroxyoctanoate) depolymerase
MSADPSGARHETGYETPVRRLTKRPMEIRQLRVYGTMLRVAIWPGSGDHTPLLLFNGIGASVELLAPFADTVGDIELITFDIPGAGESGLPPVPYRLSMMARLTAKVLDELGYDRVDVLGVSWGGAMAQQFAVLNPNRCRRLVLAATSPGVLMVPPKLSVLSKFATPRRYNDPEYRRRIAGEIYGGKARESDDAVEHFRRTRWTGYLLQQLALAGWTSLPWLRFVRQPTLVMAGDDDQVIRLANARILAKVLPHSRLRVVEGDGHLFIISSVDKVGPEIREFLTAAEPIAERG